MLTRRRPMTSTRPERTTELHREGEVRIDALSIDARARVVLTDEAVAEYAAAMKAGARFPPVVVFDDGDTLWLADGHHRVEAARRAGRMEIRAEEHKGGRRDALLYACGANATHGVRRTNADKRLAVTLILRDEEWCKWSSREIARRCAVDEGLVRRVRRELSADDPQIAPAKRRVRRGTTVYNQRAARGTKLGPDDAARIRADPRNGQEIAREYGVDKSQVSRIRANLIHVDPGYAPGLAGLRRAWDAAAAPAREEFLRWLRSEHPEMISAVITESPTIERRSMAEGQRTPDAVVGLQHGRRISGEGVRCRVRQRVA
jgi:ParB-like chromosome segregation protein Spo0J